MRYVTPKIVTANTKDGMQQRRWRRWLWRRHQRWYRQTMESATATALSTALSTASALWTASATASASKWHTQSKPRRSRRELKMQAVSWFAAQVSVKELPQHSAPPPGRSAQPVPPHAPQVLGQHLDPLGFVMPHAQRPAPSAEASAQAGAGVGVVGILHETSVAASQVLAAAAIRPWQHSSAPPGRSAQKLPPHVPHLVEQHAVPWEFKRPHEHNTPVWAASQVCVVVSVAAHG